jgi:RNA polymerase sigma-70 factor, ECF subfamily
MMQPEERSSAQRDSTSTSRSLLAGLHANEPAAWDRLVDLYAPLVWHWCRTMKLPHQDSADVFQEVFQAVAAHLHRFRNDRPTDTFRGWLRTITTNKVLDYFRAKKRQPAAAGGSDARAWWAQLPDVLLSDDAEDESNHCQELFRKALQLIQADFEERTWRAFWRVVVDGQRPQDVAEELAMSAGAVRVAKCRVLHRLRLELGDGTP